MAVDENEAMRKWAVQLPHEEIQGLGEKTKQHLIEKIKEVKAVAPRGVTNVWSFGVVFAGRYGNGTIVKTVD